MPKTDKSLAILKILRGEGGPDQATIGLSIVRVVTASPSITFQFEGTDLPIGEDIFEIPKRFQPLKEGSRYFALPITGGTMRYGILEKID